MSSAKETVLDVDGMSCASCVRHVEGALRALDGVLDVHVALAEKKVRVRHDPDRPPVAQMLDAVAAAGYEPRVAG